MTVDIENYLPAIKQVLENDPRVLFAYHYGSTVGGRKGKDIDLAIYASRDCDPHVLSSDLKARMHQETGIGPDDFDIRSLNQILDNIDVLGLLYLKNVFEGGYLLVNKDSDSLAMFLDRYGTKFRECSGLMQEILV